VRQVEITPQGVELFDAAHAAAEQPAEGLAAVLGPGETEQLSALLTRFAHPED